MLVYIGDWYANVCKVCKVAQQSREKLSHHPSKGVQFAYHFTKKTLERVFLTKKVVEIGVKMGVFLGVFLPKKGILGTFCN